jgi:hypothetical protein
MNTKVIPVFGDEILFAHFQKTLFKFVPQRIWSWVRGVKKNKTKQKSEQQGSFLCLVIGAPLPMPHFGKLCGVQK